MEAKTALDQVWAQVEKRSAAAGGGGREAASISLESLGNCCNSKFESIGRGFVLGGNGETVTEHYEIRSCRCKSWFCPDCAKIMGYQMRRNMTAVLEGWQSILMITLTVDPSLFESSEQAYRWVRERRGLSVLVQSLKRKGYTTGRYVWFLEFHKNGWPHWHMMIEADYVPHHEIAEAWGKLRPRGIEQEPGRPEFGFVDVQGRMFQSAEHAANYGTKYLVKEPKHGWPSWVMDFRGRLSRYGVCRGFWADVGVPSRSSLFGNGEPDHLDTCFCDDCRNGVNPKTGEPYRELRTPHERVSRCGRSSMLVRVRTEQRPGREPVRQYEVIGFSGASAEAICERYGVERNARGCGVVPVKQYSALMDEYCAVEQSNGAGQGSGEVRFCENSEVQGMLFDAEVFAQKRLRMNGPPIRRRYPR